MFERYTEHARRVIFFARYEASDYGSPYIETEHLLLGLLREDRAQAKWFPGQGNVVRQIRAEIEKQTTRGEPFGTSVEVPLSQESKLVLNLAAETAERLGHRYVETEHLLIGILRVEGSLAARILIARGVKLGPIEEQIAAGKTPSPQPRIETATNARMTLDSFLEDLKGPLSEKLNSFFADDAEFIDMSGRRWKSEEMTKSLETILAPYAKKNASYAIEATLVETSELFVATILWKNTLLASEQRKWMHRMSLVLVAESGDWAIILAQVTPVRFP